MRPVERGQVPQENGVDKVFIEYANARGDLIDKLDECCSYCGMHLDSCLAIEHVRPKDPNPDLELSWGNFLLACPNCNSHKGTTDVVLDEYLWPDSDNTDFAFVYGPDAAIRVNEELSDEERKRASKLLDLVKLDVEPKKSPTVSDRRWINRQEKWRIAVRKKKQLALDGCDNPAFRETIAELAYESGYWGVWISVFRDDEDLRKRLLKCVRGTASFETQRPCYDESGQCLPSINR